MLKSKVLMIQRDKEPFKAAAHSLDKFRKFNLAVESERVKRRVLNQ